MMARAAFKAGSSVPWRATVYSAAPASGTATSVTPHADRKNFRGAANRGCVFVNGWYRMRALTERYRSGHNGTDSKSVEGITSLRGFESLPLRHSNEKALFTRAFSFNDSVRSATLAPELHFFFGAAFSAYVRASSSANSAGMPCSLR